MERVDCMIVVACMLKLYNMTTVGHSCEATGGGMGGLDLFCNSYKYDKKTSREDVISKDLKSSHQTGKTFHKSYNNDIQFPLCFSYLFLL